jgi:ribosome-binding factor A
MSLRQDRVADQIRDRLALLFSLEDISDPRLSGVTITAVKVTPDLQLASVYYRILDNSEEKRKEAQKGFQSCNGFLRKKLSSVLDLRRVPELRYFFDESIERGAHIEKLLDDLD